ncbi:MAG: phosphoesterase [Verrucomicrobia bacterium]|nr:phosphoesterase [Verrucomicrobiota bacterium]
MKTKQWVLSLTLAGGLFAPSWPASAKEGPVITSGPHVLPTGQSISPLSAPGAKIVDLNPGLTDLPDFVAGGGITAVLSPDQKTLLALTSGHNLVSVTTGDKKSLDSDQYVFVFDVSGDQPQQKQVIRVPNTFAGISFDPSGQKFYIGGGKDDNIHVYLQKDGSWREEASVISLGHNGGNGLSRKETFPVTAGLAVTADGQTLVVANIQNDSVSIIDLSAEIVKRELDLRPGKIDSRHQGEAGGEYPFWVAIKGSEMAYVSSLRDREVVVVSLKPPADDLSDEALASASSTSSAARSELLSNNPSQPDAPATSAAVVLARIKVAGNPNRMLLDHAGRHLFVAEDNSDSVDIIDTQFNKVVKTIKLAGPAGALPDWLVHYRGLSPNSLALSPDERTLYVTEGGTNCVAEIDLFSGPSEKGESSEASTKRGSSSEASTKGEGTLPPKVLGLIPTTFYPNCVVVSGDGQRLFVVNGKSLTGPNPGYFERKNSNQYVLELLRSSLLTIPILNKQQLADTTKVVAENNQFSAKPPDSDHSLMAYLRRQIKHVLYIVKENRTYDQILGDLDRGNGDRSLTQFGSTITPNFHHLAQQFVCLDNFYDPGDVSANGWPWSTAGRESDFGVKAVVLNYAKRGMTYDFEGTNRDINIGLGSLADRVAANPLTPEDPDVLPGTADVAAPDGPNSADEGMGYLWDVALRAGKSVRNYGFFCDLSRYEEAPPDEIPLERHPFEKKLQVAYPTKAGLIERTDLYFRSFDTAFPDYWREVEWEREFDRFVREGQMPDLCLVRFMEDHMGSFKKTIDGINTPERQQADNDYAVGRLVEKIAASPFKDNTLIFVVEDDAQNGADHVDSHRSTAYVVGPFIKQGQVVSQFYTTVNVLRTIEDILGTEHLNIHTATARPISEVFDLKQETWKFKAEPSSYLKDTGLPLADKTGAMHPTHDAAYWAAATAQFDFSKEDNLGDPDAFNRIIWKGLKGDVPYPGDRRIER